MAKFLAAEASISILYEFLRIEFTIFGKEDFEHSPKIEFITSAAKISNNDTFAN